MSFLDTLFGSSTAPAPQPAPDVPQQPRDYATFFKNLAAAADANLNAKTWSQRNLWNVLSGDDRKAAQANVTASAPAAYDAYQAGHTGVQSGQVDLGQTLAYINNFRRAQNLPPVDPNNLSASIAGGAPTTKPSLSPDPGASPNAQDLMVPQSAPRAAPSPIAPSMQPPVSATPLAPPQGTPTSADQSALFTRLAGAAANPVLPLNNVAGMFGGQSDPTQPPQTAPSTVANPLDAQRAAFGRMAMAMSGLPKFAAVLPEVNKLINQGVEPGRTVNYGTGQVSDVNTSRPITFGANEDAAAKAGAVATAQQAPHVAAEDYLARLGADLTRGNQANEAGLQRGTDAARIGAENAYKSPTLMRAPNGSIVGVSPTQMAEASRTGALAGYRPLSEEDTKALGAMGEQYVKDQAALPDLRKAQNTIRTMLDQAQAFPPGTFGDVRASAGRLLAGIGANPDAVAKIVGSPAGADVIFKNTMTLAMDRLKSSFGAQREAGFIVEKAMQANPNVSTQPEAYSFMLNTMFQEAQRQADYLAAQQTYRAQHGTIDGFAEQFDQARPIAAYANQAMADTYGAPTGSKFLGRSQGKPVFQAPNGRKFMVQH